MTDHAIIRFITLQLPFLLDANIDARVTFEIMVLVGKKSLKPKLDGKTRRKTGGLIDEKLPKLNKETRRKTNHLLLCRE